MDSRVQHCTAFIGKAAGFRRISNLPSTEGGFTTHISCTPALVYMIVKY